MTASATATADLTAAEPLARPHWRDRKRYFWLLGLLVPVLPFMAWGMVELTGLGVLWFFGPIFVFGVMPVLDTLVGKDSANPPDSVIKWLEQDRYYRWCTYLYLPIQYASLIVACALWAHGGLSLIEQVGLATTVGSVSGIAINTAHELGHKRASMERSPRPATATSSSSTTADTTYASPPPRTRPARAWARASTASGRAPSPAACAPAGSWRPSDSAACSAVPGRFATTSSMPGP
jgi:hypothetical protein